MTAAWATLRLLRLLLKLLRSLLSRINILLIGSCSCRNSNYLADMKIVWINARICIYNVLYAHTILICDLIKRIALLNDICYHEIITSVPRYELTAVSVIKAEKRRMTPGCFAVK